jgi:hypothetical protein
MSRCYFQGSGTDWDVAGDILTPAITIVPPCKGVLQSPDQGSHRAIATNIADGAQAPRQLLLVRGNYRRYCFRVEYRRWLVLAPLLPVSLLQLAVSAPGQPLPTLRARAAFWSPWGRLPLVQGRPDLDFEAPRGRSAARPGGGLPASGPVGSDLGRHVWRRHVRQLVGCDGAVGIIALLVIARLAVLRHVCHVSGGEANQGSCV